MSAAATRSPSPGPVVRPCCGVRRSADSSPFRSTSLDSPQRSASVGKNNGGGRASSRASWTEKENDHHHHPRDAARTPKSERCGTGGGAKSFMAPTISAASKAVAAASSASPRKKVLGERNNDPIHPVPSSPGDLLAHAKPRCPPPTEEAALGAPRRLRLSLDGAPPPPPPVPAAAPVASHSLQRCSLGGDARREEVENPVSKVNHNDESGGAAAPYDPKTNFLSPRPRFLRYRPNPRIEQYRQSCAGGSVRRLEDGFASSESSEEADTTTTEEEEEEGLSEEEQQESSPLAPAPDTCVDPGASVAADVLPPEPVPTQEPGEPAAISPRACAPIPKLEPATTPAPGCAKKKKKSSLRFLLVAPLSLVLFMAASFVCVSPPPGSPVVLNASLSKVSDYFLSVQELHPVELAAWLKQWSSSSLDLVSSQEQEFFGPHVAANLSAAAADDADHSVGFYYSAAETRPMPTEQEEPTSASILEPELEIQDIVSAIDTVAIYDGFEVQEMVTLGDGTVEDEPTGDDEMVQESVSETSNVIEELNEYVDGHVAKEVLHGEMAEEVSGSSGEEMGSYNQDLGIPSQSEPKPEHIVDDMEVPSLQQEVQTDESEGDQEAPVKKDEGPHHGQKLGSSMWSGYLDKLSKPAVAGSVLAVLIVSAALAFLYTRQNQARVFLNPNEPVEQVERVENRSGSGSSEGHTRAEEGSHLQYPVVEETERIGYASQYSEGHTRAEEGSHLQYPVVEETERIGDPDASQYSSSLSSGLTRRRKDTGEQSLEPMSRRDSTGYSTSSYGSFTTYEKISAKKKNKDEAMTPVRRSSRLRNQVKSPEA